VDKISLVASTAFLAWSDQGPLLMCCDFIWGDAPGFEVGCVWEWLIVSVSLFWGGVCWPDVGRFPFGLGTARPRLEESVSALSNELLHCKDFLFWDLFGPDVTGCVFAVFETVSFCVPPDTHLGFSRGTIPSGL